MVKRIEIFLVLLFLILKTTFASEGVIVYGRQASPGMVYARYYTSPTSVGSEYTTIATSSSAIQFIKIKAAPTREEYITVHLKADGRLDVLRCVNLCNQSSDWSLIGTFTGATSTTNANKRAFDVAYEQLSGRAIVVFADDPTTGKAYYCIWNGTSWYPSSTCGSTFTPGTANEINFGTTGVPLWIRLVEKPSSDEMLLGILDSAGTYAVARWNGSAWTNILNIGTSAAVTAQQCFDLAWESISGNGLIVFDKTSADGTTQYRKYVAGVGWDTSDTAGPDTGAGNNYWIELASDPGSNRISMIIADSESDAHLYIWKADGSTPGFTTTSPNPIDGGIETTTGKDVATVWSRGNTRALFSYTDSNALTQDVVCWTPSGGFTTVTSDVGGSNTDDVDNIIYIGSPSDGDAFALRGDIVDDLVATRWDGLGCAAADFTRIPSTGTLASDLSVTTDNSAPIEFSFAYRIYYPEFITVTLSNYPICFGSVSGTGIEVNASDGSKTECGTGIKGFPMNVYIESNVNTSIWLRGDTNLLGSYSSINVENLKCANNSNPSSKMNLLLNQYILFQQNIQSGSTVPIYWWLFVPSGQVADVYEGNITILVNKTT
jgi:hypothetical protein